MYHLIEMNKINLINVHFLCLPKQNEPKEKALFQRNFACYYQKIKTVHMLHNQQSRPYSFPVGAHENIRKERKLYEPHEMTNKSYG